MSKKKKPVRCEGWRRTGIFQMGGTGRWEQCNNPAEFKVTVAHKTKAIPVCAICCKEAQDNAEIIVKKVVPL